MYISSYSEWLMQTTLKIQGNSISKSRTASYFNACLVSILHYSKTYSHLTESQQYDIRLNVRKPREIFQQIFNSVHVRQKWFFISQSGWNWFSQRSTGPFVTVELLHDLQQHRHVMVLSNHICRLSASSQCSLFHYWQSSLLIWQRPSWLLRAFTVTYPKLGTHQVDRQFTLLYQKMWSGFQWKNQDSIKLEILSYWCVVLDLTSTPTLLFLSSALGTQANVLHIHLDSIYCSLSAEHCIKEECIVFFNTKCVLTALISLVKCT